MHPYLQFALLWGVPVLFLLCSYSPNLPEGIVRNRRSICGVLLLVFLYVAGWFHLTATPSAMKTPTGFLAEQTLKSLYRLKPGAAPAWLLVSALALFWFREEITSLINKLSRGGSVELVGLKLQLPGESEVAGGTSPLPLTLVEATPDLVSIRKEDSIFPGTVGVMQPGPSCPPPWHTKLMSAVPTFFQGMTQANQDSYGEALYEMEYPISEEYEQYIAASVQYLSRHARRKKITLNEYLSNVISIRRMMLYFHGRTEQARLLVRDMPQLGLDGRKYFFDHALAVWLLFGLCRDKDWDTANALTEEAKEFPYADIVRRAFSAYIALARRRSQEAVGLARVAIESWKNSGQPWMPVITTLQFVLAQGLYDIGRPEEALVIAVELVTDKNVGQQGLAGALRSAGMHVITRASLDLGLAGKLTNLYSEYEALRYDPFLLNALAVVAGRKRKRDQALQYLREAEANLPRNGGEELLRVIRHNRKALMGVHHPEAKD